MDRQPEKAFRITHVEYDKSEDDAVKLVFISIQQSLHMFIWGDAKVCTADAQHEEQSCQDPRQNQQEREKWPDHSIPDAARQTVRDPIYRENNSNQHDQNQTYHHTRDRDQDGKDNIRRVERVVDALRKTDETS